MSKNLPNNQQPRQFSDEEIEAMAHAAMLHKGKLMPTTDGLTRTPAVSHPLPENLRDPRAVLRRGQELLRAKERASDDPVSILPASPIIQQELGRVAREGCAEGIPEDVEQIMKNARQRVVPNVIVKSTSPAKLETITASQTRLNEIALLAEAVLDDYVQPDNKIDPFAIANELNIPILPDDYKGAFDGLLEYRESKFLIYYDAKRLGGPQKPRVRFTIAHELGHYFIDEHREALRAGVAPPHGSKSNFTSSNPVEREADTFAANLLLPNSRFLGVAKKIKPTLQTILPVSDQFGTSWTSTVLRFVQLDLHPCAIAIVRSDAIAWSWASESLAKLTYPNLIRAVSQIPEGSTRKILNCPDNFKDGHIEKNATTAEFWFLYASGNRNVMLFEEAVSLRDYGVLTFLSLMEL